MTPSELAQASKDKAVIKKFSYRDFVSVCDELGVVEKAVRELISIADGFGVNDNLKVSIYKWLIEMNVGKAKQMVTVGETDDLKIGIVRSIFENPDELKRIDNEPTE